jgi:membrane-associated phospholipid phosphatase
MLKRIVLYATLLFISTHAFSQYDSSGSEDKNTGEVYKLKLPVDIPVTAAGVAWSIYAFPKIYDKPSSTEAEILRLNKEDLNGFDRWAAGKYNETADKNSDMLFYGSIPLPLLLFIDKDIRKDALKISFMYLETFAVTGIFYTGSAYVFDRYRPFAYGDKAPMLEKINGNTKNSFLAGHPALVGTATFFMAKVYGDYHPDSKFKYALYGFAIAATGTTAYLRHIAGKHFPSDLVTGTAMGVLTGILMPHAHKNKYFNQHVRLLPYTGNAHGLTVLYKF